MNIDRLLNEYERGRLSRRELLGALALLAAGAAASTRDAAAAPIGAVTQMNHVSIFVPDVEKSKQFYQDTFALPVLGDQPAMMTSALCRIGVLIHARDRRPG